MRISIIGLLILGTFTAIAQPNTEIYLLEYLDGQYVKPINISKNLGYDNQPSFWEDGESILYARTIDGQTEIARYFIDSKETKVITSTGQGSEYSPTQIPGSSDISSVRLDTSGLQLLYTYKPNGSSEVLVPELKIGYHAWVDAKTLATFVLGEPATLQKINLKNGKAEILADNIGRSIHSIPGKKSFSYVDMSVEPWTILEYHPKKRLVLAELPAGVMDYCWSAMSSSIVYSEGSTILSNDGQLLTDLKADGITGKISRINISPDGRWLAVVVEN